VRLKPRIGIVEKMQREGGDAGASASARSCAQRRAADADGERSV
jgi:hypothetical protein